MSSHQFKLTKMSRTKLSFILLIFQFSCALVYSNSCILPRVKLYHLDQNGTVLHSKVGNESLTFESKSDIRFLLFCEHHTPIHWIINEDRNFIAQPSYFNESHDEASVTSRSFLAFQDPSTYNYKAKYFLELLKPHAQIFTCKSFDKTLNGKPSKNTTSKSCDQTVIFGQLDKVSRVYTLKPIPNDQSGRLLLQKLEQSLKKKSRPKQNQIVECPIKLSIGLTNDSAFVSGWLPESGSKDHVHVDNAQTLYNLFIDTEPLEDRCIKRLKTDDEIIACTSCDQVDYELYNHRPFVFSFSHGNNMAVVKGFFDIGEYIFHFTSEEVDPEVLTLMDIIHPEYDGTDPIEEIYQGESVAVKCFQSVVLFSVGTQIAWSSISQDSSMLNFLNVSESESAKPGGVFEASGELSLDRNYLMENDINSIQINCISPFWDSSEWFHKRQMLILKKSELPKIIHINTTRNYNESQTISNSSSPNPSLRIIEADEGAENFTIWCVATGIPLPSRIQFLLPKLNFDVVLDTDEEDESETTIAHSITFPKIELHHEGTYQCIAKSTIGEDIVNFRLEVTRSKWGHRFKMTMLITGVIATILFILSSIALLMKLRRDKRRYSKETDETIRKFKEGFPTEELNLGFRASGSEHLEYEIPLTRWGIGETLLGSGAFGVVQKGTIYHDESRKSVVAVKRVISTKDVKDFETSLIELTIMCYLGKHEHIVSLIAACTDNIDKRSILIGVEYCANGDLLKYVQHRRALFQTVVTDGEIVLQKEYSDYLNLIAANFCTLDLYKWGYQIASGMNYLGSRKVLHCDLAARNVLLTSDNIAKISDFGLSRQLIASDNYTKKTNTPLPWKWMAPESLRFMQFSSATDVWSYGVTLYEIFTLGSEPWPYQHQWTNEFIQELQGGGRMKRPKYATENMFAKVIMGCWKYEPDNRITFENARDFFETAISHLNSPEGKDDEFLNSVC